jgi:hypothetical protein
MSAKQVRENTWEITGNTFDWQAVEAQRERNELARLRRLEREALEGYASVWENIQARIRYYNEGKQHCIETGNEEGKEICDIVRNELAKVAFMIETRLTLIGIKERILGNK